MGTNYALTLVSDKTYTNIPYKALMSGSGLSLQASLFGHTNGLFVVSNIPISQGFDTNALKLMFVCL